jgi:hypothetical protein
MVDVQTSEMNAKLPPFKVWNHEILYVDRFSKDEQLPKILLL